MRNILKNKQGLIGLVMILTVIIVAVLAPYIAPNNPNEVDISHKFLEGNDKFPLGTDQLGRCIISRLMYGARFSLFIALTVLIILIIISVTLGITTAYFGGIVDYIFQSICNIFICFPPLVVVLALSGFLGSSIKSLIISFVLSMWVWFVKVIRSYVLIEKNKDYIISSKLAGCSDKQIIFNHILPNIAPSLVVYFSTSIGALILMLSGYAFLGVGLDTNTPEWGSMLSDGKTYLYASKALIVYPGLCILYTATGFNLLGEALKDIFAPRGN